ncbi:hypothetical protein PZA11_006437 [Diplocarpon coronariae]
MLGSRKYDDWSLVVSRCLPEDDSRQVSSNGEREVDRLDDGVVRVRGLLLRCDGDDLPYNISRLHIHLGPGRRRLDLDVGPGPALALALAPAFLLGLAWLDVVYYES